MRTKSVTLKNPRTGEIWLCEDFTNRRVVDGAEFVEVHSPKLPRKFWMSLDALVKVKDKNLNKV